MGDHSFKKADRLVNLPASNDPNKIEVVTTDDAMYLRIAKIGQAMMNFYDFVADGKPEDIEAYFNKYPETAKAKLKIAPVALARLIPIRQTIELPNGKELRRRLSPEELKAMGVTKQQLLTLVEKSSSDEVQ